MTTDLAALQRRYELNQLRHRISVLMKKRSCRRRHRAMTKLMAEFCQLYES